MKDEPSQDRKPAEQPGPGTKRPYEKPAIGWEEPWDAHANLMAACGRKDAMQPSCEFDLSS